MSDTLTPAMRPDFNFSRPAPTAPNTYTPAELEAAARKPRPAAGQIWRHLKYGLHRVQLVSTWWASGALVVTVLPLDGRTDQGADQRYPASKTYSIEEFTVAFAPNACVGCGMDMTGQKFVQHVTGLICALCDPREEGEIRPQSAPTPERPRSAAYGLAGTLPFGCSTPNVVPPTPTGPRVK